MIILDHAAPPNSMGPDSSMNGIGQSLVSGIIIVQRRPARSAFGAFLFTLYVYIFIYRGSNVSASWAQQSLQPQLDEIPPRIWQIFFGYTPLDEFAPALHTWISKNQDYRYALMSNQGADDFARKYYADRPDVLEPFLQLKTHVLRSDLLRYMILESVGGIYSDLDTVADKSVRDWFPQEMRSKVHAVVGVEYDQLDGEPYYHMSDRIQFCQWTMAASQGHPIMSKIVKKVVTAIHEMAGRNNTSIANFKPSDMEVLQLSGPVIWTHEVMEAMSEVTGSEMSYLNFTGMTEPRLFGDALVLPIDGFGAGQPHSNSTRDDNQGPGNIYVRHHFKGSWRKDPWK